MTMKKTLSNLLGNIQSDDVLHLLGLERRRTSTGLASVGLIAFGAVIGAGAALLLAPEKGSVLRGQIAGKLPTVMPKVNEVVAQVKTGFAQLKDHAEATANQAVSTAPSIAGVSVSKTTTPRTFPS